MTLLHRAWAPSILVIVGASCVPEDDPGPPAEVELGDEVVCATPGDRWADLAPVDVGVDVPFADPQDVGRFRSYEAPLAVHDIDADGDLDVLAGRWDGPPTLYINDRGRFTVAPAPFGPTADTYEEVSTFGVVDLDDDGLPELLLGGPGYVLVSAGVGADAGFFGEPEELWRVPIEEHIPSIASMAWGDVDGDGDLDLALAAAFLIPAGSTWPPDPDDPPWGGDPPPPADDMLLRNHGGDFTLDRELRVANVTAPSQLVAFTDRDHDGDPDLLLATDQGRSREPSAFFRNDGNDLSGRPILVDDAPEVGADLRMSAMGLAAADLDGDGLLDYCMTDIGPLRCLLTDGGGGVYIDAGVALGLTAETAERSDRWSGWSLEIEDLDNDGVLDAVAAGGDPGDLEPGADDPALFDHPNTLWRGGRDPDLRFTDVTADVGFGALRDDYGLVTADLDGDGVLEVLTFGTSGAPAVWSGPCTEGAWIDVDLVGPPGNSEGYGARVEVAGASARELHGVRTQGQGPSRVHVGLGDADEAELTVRWPDGEVTSATVPTRRRIVVRHPSRI